MEWSQTWPTAIQYRLYAGQLFTIYVSHALTTTYTASNIPTLSDKILFIK